MLPWNLDHPAFSGVILLFTASLSQFGNGLLFALDKLRSNLKDYGNYSADEVATLLTASTKE
jgi:hypothetical protein